MAKITLNNNTILSTIRAAINSMFTELYTDKDTQDAAIALKADALTSDQNYVSDAQLANIHAPGSDDQDLSGKQDLMTAASQAEMEAGTQTAIRSMSPLRVAQAIAALAAGGGGDDLGNATASDVAALFTGYGYLKTDGTADVPSGSEHDAVTLGTANGLSLSSTGGQVLNLAAATNAAAGAATAAHVQAIEAIPTALSALSDDVTHRLVTDTEKSTWSGKLAPDGSAASLTDFPTLNQSTTGNAATVTNATLTTALTVDTGAVQLTGNVGGSSRITIPNGTANLSTGTMAVVDGALGNATATSIGFGASPSTAGGGGPRLSNNQAIFWKAASGSDIPIAVDGSDIVQIGQNAAGVNFNSASVTNADLSSSTNTLPATLRTKQPSTLVLTTDTSITEAQLLNNDFITNQGASGEIDITLPAVSYYITRTIIVTAEQIIEIAPPTGEAFDLAGTMLDINDVADSPAVVGTKIVVTRTQSAVGAWYYSLDVVRGTWVDSGASD